MIDFGFDLEKTSAEVTQRALMDDWCYEIRPGGEDLPGLDAEAELMNVLATDIMLEVEEFINKGNQMDFGDAVRALKQGKKVARSGWNGKSMFLFLVPGSTFEVNRPPLSTIYPEGTKVDYHAHIDMKTAQGYVIPWLASQADCLSEDWVIVE